MRQYVVLGAGLDSFAHRAEWAHDVGVFEVDQPTMSTYKRQLVADAGSRPLAKVAFVPARLGQDPLLPALAEAGLDLSAPAVITWLGVTNYLPRQRIHAVLAELADAAPGSTLVLDYIIPAEMRDEAGAAYADAVMQAAAERQEPWVTFLTTSQAAELLEQPGWRIEEDLAQDDAIDADVRDHAHGLPRFQLTRLVTARLSRSPGAPAPHPGQRWLRLADGHGKVTENERGRFPWVFEHATASADAWPFAPG